jgi:hypothetical protein
VLGAVVAGDGPGPIRRLGPISGAVIMPPEPIIGHVPVTPPEPWDAPSGCQPKWPLEDQPNKIPEKKITAETNTTPAMMPTQAKT